MSEVEDLKAEIQSLRAEVEAYRQRELEELRQRLATAEADVQHYRAEAQRNAQLGHQIHIESRQEVERLRSQLEAKERLTNGRPAAPGRPQ